MGHNRNTTHSSIPEQRLADGGVTPRLREAPEENEWPADPIDLIPTDMPATRSRRTTARNAAAALRRIAFYYDELAAAARAQAERIEATAELFGLD